MTTILLAAGLSERMGRNKLLLPFRGKTIIESTLETVLSISDETIVITGHDRDALLPILRQYNVQIIHNIDYQKGQKGSSLLGVENVSNDDFAILPADLPLLEKSDIEGVYSLLDKYKTARAVYENIPGHPVAYRKNLREELLRFDGTMKEFVHKKTNGHYQASIGCVFDIDTPDRYESLLSNYQ